MTTRDIIVTPLLIILVFLVTILSYHRTTDRVTRKYFYPALIIKIIGAVALGFIYQFYYQSGDTFTFFNQGSYYIWKAFQDSPAKGLSLIFSQAGHYSVNTYEYASKITFFRDPSSFFVIRVAGILDLITFHTYSSTAILFAIFSFTGSWAMYSVFYRMFPRLHLQLALAIFFIPSVFFWGSGLMKDSLTFGALGWATYAFIKIFIRRESILTSALILLISFYIIYEVKIYILLCYIPSLLIWLYFRYLTVIRNLVLRAMLLPFILAVIVAAGYYSIIKISSENTRYNLSSISETAKATAQWISYVSDTEGGSTYTLGDYDFSPVGMLRKAPMAVWVTLFRPYIWESRNAVMILSALESLFFLLVTLYVLFVSGPINASRIVFTKPIIIFCLIFSLLFSFAVGISTYNFGSLVRYKIPMMPFYMIAMILINYYSKRPKKLRRLDAVEN
jgi:hypothetical protein